MKIAAITDDGFTISQHFGRAPYYVVATIEDGKVIAMETRPKLGHAQFSQESHGHEHESNSPQGHGFDPAAQDRHARMAQSIKDCEALLCRGMGAGAYQSMLDYGIRPIVTDIVLVEEAIQDYLQGTITDHPEKLH
jgi:predicted Fe-Mo cluster-binding NifX family protein